MTRPFVFDMETSDPDDFLTLLLLLGHPEVDLRAVTVTPGSREQIGLVRWALAKFDKDIPVGAFKNEEPSWQEKEAIRKGEVKKKEHVSAWHYKAYGMPKTESEAEPGWEVLRDTLGPDTTLVTGAALKNLGRLLRETTDDPKPLGRLFIQGGFAGVGVVDPEVQLEKFQGKMTCPSFNLNGDPKSVLRVLENRARFSDLRFVSKNVCHGVIYDQEMHDHVTAALAATCGDHAVCKCPCHEPGAQILHIMACCEKCPRCGAKILYDTAVQDRRTVSLFWIHRGMEHYLKKRPTGKAFHDPLAACCAIDPDIGKWAEVEVYRSKGEWGSRLAEGSGVRIIVDYDHKRFLGALLSLNLGDTEDSSSILP